MWFWWYSTTRLACTETNEAPAEAFRLNANPKKISLPVQELVEKASTLEVNGIQWDIRSTKNNQSSKRHRLYPVPPGAAAPPFLTATKRQATRWRCFDECLQGLLEPNLKTCSIQTQKTYNQKRIGNSTALGQLSYSRPAHRVRKMHGGRSTIKESNVRGLPYELSGWMLRPVHILR